MTTQNYLMVQNNIVTNIVVWDGNAQTWMPPSDATMLVQTTTSVTNWVWNVDTKTWSLQQETGTGAIGFIWNGTVLTTNLPEPAPITSQEITQPQTTGTQSA